HTPATTSPCRVFITHRPRATLSPFPYTTPFRSPASLSSPALLYQPLFLIMPSGASATLPPEAIYLTPPESLTDHVPGAPGPSPRSEEHTSELQSQSNIVCRLLLEKKKQCARLWR